MRKASAVLFALFIVLLTSCSPSPSPTLETKLSIRPNEITSFSYANYGLGYSAEYYINKDNFTASSTVYNHHTSQDFNTSEVWSIETWDSFASELSACAIARWDGDYDKHMTDGDVWIVNISGDFGKISIRGNNAYPEGWHEFQQVLDKYFPSEASPSPEIGHGVFRSTSKSSV